VGAGWLAAATGCLRLRFAVPHRSPLRLRRAYVPAADFLDSIASCQNLVVFTGSGLSANSGELARAAWLARA
jgi:hypothetical protein